MRQQGKLRTHVLIATIRASRQTGHAVVAVTASSEENGTIARINQVSLAVHSGHILKTAWLKYDDCPSMVTVSVGRPHTRLATAKSHVPAGGPFRLVATVRVRWSALKGEREQPAFAG
jgi:hypothetical protein